MAGGIVGREKKLICEFVLASNLKIIKITWITYRILWWWFSTVNNQMIDSHHKREYEFSVW